MVWCDVIWCMWCDMMWHGVMWYDMMWYNIIWHDMIWYGMMWCDMMWCDVMWYDMICYVMIWYDVLWYEAMYLIVISKSNYSSKGRSHIQRIIYYPVNLTNTNYCWITCISNQHKLLMDYSYTLLVFVVRVCRDSSHPLYHIL